MTVQMISLMEAALDWAHYVPVFPCKPERYGKDEHKTPLTPHSFKDATQDAEQIKRWWTKHPDALIGMPTGEASGIAVLDIDVKPEKGKDGRIVIPDWETLTNNIVKTQSGGLHLWFTDDPNLRCSTDKIGHGVDVRAEGGYVIVPPSTGYSWLKEGPFYQLPLWPEKYRPAEKRTQPSPNKNPLAEPEKVTAWLRDIANPDFGFDDWKKIGLAVWRATEGSEQGFNAFDAWSKKSNKYDPEVTRKQWDGITTSPPSSIGAGTLAHLANEARAKSRPVASSEALPTIKDGDPIPLMNWLIRNRVPEVGAGLLAGQYSTFKSFLLLDLAGSVMTGRDWTGESVYRRGGVLMLAPEGSFDLGLRVAALKEHRLKLESLKEQFPTGRLPIEWASSSPVLLGEGKNDPLPQLIATAAAAEKRFQDQFGLPLVLISIDTVAACAGWEDENSNADASRVLKVLHNLSKATKAAVIGIDHAGKDAERGTRGASSKDADADFVFITIGNKKQTGEVTDLKLAVRKNRYGPQGMSFPFEGQQVDMGKDERNNPVTSRIINWDVKPKPAAEAPKGTAGVLDQALSTALRTQGTVITVDGEDYHAATREIVRNAFVQAYKPGEALLSAAQERFRVALKDALASYRVGCATLDGQEWLWRIEQM